MVSAPTKDGLSRINHAEERSAAWAAILRAVVKTISLRSGREAPPRYTDSARVIGASYLAAAAANDSTTVRFTDSSSGRQ